MIGHFLLHKNINLSLLVKLHPFLPLFNGFSNGIELKIGLIERLSYKDSFIMMTSEKVR